MVTEAVDIHSRQSARVAKAAAVWVVAIAIAQPLTWLLRFFVLPIDPGRATYALAAMMLYLPVELYLSVAATRLRPLPVRWLVLIVLLVLAIAPLPLLGAGWLGTWYTAAALTLVMLPRPWSLVGFVGLVAGAALASIGLDHAEWAGYFALGIPLFALPIAIVLTLTRNARELQELRLQLAAQAVLHERVRAADDLRETIVDALEAIVEQSEAAGNLADADPAVAGRYLRLVVDSARSTLADTRGLIRRYQSSSLDAELQTAAGLLKAVGYETHLVVPPTRANVVLDESERVEIQKQVMSLLTEPSPSHAIIITVVEVDGRPHVEIRQPVGTARLSGVGVR